MDEFEQKENTFIFTNNYDFVLLPWRQAQMDVYSL